MQPSRICFLSKWRCNLSNGKEEAWKQYLDLNKQSTATVETSALFMIETGLIKGKKVKLKKEKRKKSEKKLLFLVYIFSRSIKSVYCLMKNT